MFYINALTSRGRSSRSAFWWPNLGYIGLTIFLLMLLQGAAQAIIVVLSLVLFLPFLHLTARRFQDIGYSGWFALIQTPLSMPGIVNWLFDTPYWGLPVLLLIFVFVIVVGATPGMNGSNAFGPDIEANA